MPLRQNRVDVSDESVEQAIAIVVGSLRFRMEEKGRESYISDFETVGLITEEYHELIAALISNDDLNVTEELIDIAVGCIFGVASQIEFDRRG